MARILPEATVSHRSFQRGTLGVFREPLDPCIIPLRYLQAYPASLQDQVRQLTAGNRLGEYLERRYPRRHDVQSDKALYAYIMDLEQEHLRSIPGLDKAFYDNKLDVAQYALSLYTAILRAQGGKLKVKEEIRMASLSEDATPEFLRMIVVHELAHLEKGGHNEALYQLRQYMLPNCHQLEFNLRVYLT